VCVEDQGEKGRKAYPKRKDKEQMVLRIEEVKGECKN